MSDSEMTFRGLGIWDLGIVGLGFVNLGHERAPFRAVEPWVEGTVTVASSYGPSTKGAGTRVCGYAIKNSGLTVV